MKTTIQIDTELFRQLNAVLRKMINDHPYSKDFAELDQNHPFFHDSCNFVGLSARLSELASWFYGMAAFVEMNKEIFPVIMDDVHND